MKPIRHSVLDVAPDFAGRAFAGRDSMGGAVARRRCPLLLWMGLALVVLALSLVRPVAAQDVTPDPREPAAESVTGKSLVGAFFVSKKTNPATNEESIELLGSLVIWFLLCLSVLSIGLIGNMAWVNQRKAIYPEAVVAEISMLVKRGRYKEVMELTRLDRSFFSEVLHAGLRESSHGFAAVLRAMELASSELTTNRLRRVEYLNVLGQVSPMIGLFGTVYGMILAFQAIVLTGGNADPIMLAGGISTALTTTFWGLVVAIPALAGYAIVRNRIDAYTTEATLAAEELLNQFRPRGSGRNEPLFGGETGPRETTRQAPVQAGAAGRGG